MVEWTARQLRRARRLSWAVADQALFAGSNFFLGVLTARWMEPQHYGAFATALAVYVLLMSLYEAVVTEPMMVFGARRFAERFRPYLGTLIAGHLPVAAVGSVVLMVAAIRLDVVNQPELSAALFALAVTGPLILLRSLFRQACYASSRPRLATWGGGIYAFTMGAGLLALHSYRDFTHLHVFSALAVAALTSSAFLMWKLRPLRPDRRFAREIAHKHWEFGRWGLGAHFVRWIPGHIWFFVLPLWVSLEQNAAFRALLNLNLVVTHVMSALAMLLLPTLVRAYAASEQRFQRVSRDAAILIVGLGLGYWAVVNLAGETVVAWLYDGKYVEQSWLLVLIGFAPLAIGVKTLFASRARALERPDIVFNTTLLSLAGLVPALGLGYRYGLLGVAVGYLLVHVVGAGLLVYSTFGGISRWAGRQRKGPSDTRAATLVEEEVE
jgi:O-antigen/teichoic acid export membrane protein